MTVKIYYLYYQTCQKLCYLYNLAIYKRSKNIRTETQDKKIAKIVKSWEMAK